jgi:hypothetical protein
MTTSVLVARAERLADPRTELTARTTSALRWETESLCARSASPALWDVDHQDHKRSTLPCELCIDALRICMACPVREACAEDAVRFGDISTLRGGWALRPSTRDAGPAPIAAHACAWCGLPILSGLDRTACSSTCAYRLRLR